MNFKMESSDTGTMWRLAILLLCCFYGVCCALEVDLTVEVRPGAVECFWQPLKNRVSAEIEYQVWIRINCQN